MGAGHSDNNNNNNNNNNNGSCDESDFSNGFTITTIFNLFVVSLPL